MTTMADIGMTSIGLTSDWATRRWMQEAACVGKASLFFAPLAERPQARARREAKADKLCRACPAVGECRDYARRNLEYGFWGGENEEERSMAGYVVPNAIGSRRRRAS